MSYDDQGLSWLQKWLLIASGCLLLLGACGTLVRHTSRTSESPKATATGEAQAKQYLRDHPAPVRPGFRAGILLGSKTVTVTLFCSEDCQTWSGQVIVAGDESLPLESEYGYSVVGTIISPGDYFYFKAGGPVSTAADVEVITRRAIDPQATTAPTPR